MIKQAIVLAGGLGTRLRSVVAEIPKCLAPVAGKPFLYYVIRHLKKEGIHQFIFSTGYKSESIEKYLAQQHSGITYRLSIEDEPLGTGGAIKLACALITDDNVLIVNGDTLFTIDMAKLNDAQLLMTADCILSLKPMNNFERYGVVELNTDMSVRSFKEKQFYESGLINGGIYALNVQSFLKETLPEKFSFEKDFLEKYFYQRKMYGVIQDEYFIDIGIPEDYERANRELG